MIAPYAKFNLQAFLYYQGENNFALGGTAGYGDKMMDLIEGWRADWGGEDNPFYYVALVPLNYSNWYADVSLPTDMGLFWEEQFSATSLTNTGIISSTDLADRPFTGSLNDEIHPKNKRPVGERLAAWSIANDYDIDVVYSGPVFKSIKNMGGTQLEITFEHTDGGLNTTDTAAPNWFEIAESNQIFQSINASINTDSTVLIDISNIDDPMYLRMAWHEEADPKLSNSSGIPAFPFRTDIPIPSSILKKNEVSLEVFPNPVDDVLNVMFSEQGFLYSLEVYDLTGRLLLEKEETVNSFQLNIGHLPEGVYLIKAKHSDKTEIVKFIKTGDK